VRDLLRQRKITLVRQAGSPADGATRKQDKPTVAVAVAATNFEASRLVDRLRREGYGCGNSPKPARGGGARSVRRSGSRHRSRFACRRRSGSRRHSGQSTLGRASRQRDDPRDVARATAAVDANVLVVRSAGQSEYLLQRLTTAWLTARPNVNEQVRELLK